MAPQDYSYAWLNKKSLVRDLRRLEKIIGLVSLVADTRIRVGRVRGPFGTEIHGFQITIGGPPEEVERRFDDIKAIVKSNPDKFKTHEERHPDGTFKSFTVET